MKTYNTAAEFIIECELYEYSVENYQMSQLMTQLALQEQALVAHQLLIESTELNDAQKAILTESVQNANLPLTAFTESSDDESEEKTGFFASIGKVWKFIIGKIKSLFSMFGNWVKKIVNKITGSKDKDGVDTNVDGVIKKLKQMASSADADAKAADKKAPKEMLKKIITVCIGLSNTISNTSKKLSAKDILTTVEINNLVQAYEVDRDDMMKVNVVLQILSQSGNSVFAPYSYKEMDGILNKFVSLLRAISNDTDGKKVESNTKTLAELTKKLQECKTKKAGLVNIKEYEDLSTKLNTTCINLSKGIADFDTIPTPSKKIKGYSELIGNAKKVVVQLNTTTSDIMKDTSELLTNYDAQVKGVSKLNKILDGEKVKV